MDKKSKVISGLKCDNSFTVAERHKIIQELLCSRSTKVEIWEKYTGKKEEHGRLLKWMRELGYADECSVRRFNFGGNNDLMPKKKNLLTMY